LERAIAAPGFPLQPQSRRVVNARCTGSCERGIAGDASVVGIDEANEI
jgi:hypothetical protein